jgi:hypothetical protein
MRLAWRITETRIYANTRSIYYVLFHNLLIPSYLAKEFMATLAITEKLINDLSAITICLDKLCEDGLKQRNTLFSVLCVYAKSEKSKNSLLYNFFKKLVTIICMVAGDTILL